MSKVAPVAAFMAGRQASATHDGAIRRNFSTDQAEDLALKAGMEYQGNLARADEIVHTGGKMKSLGSWLLEFLLFGLGVISVLVFIAGVMGFPEVMRTSPSTVAVMLLLMPVIGLVAAFLFFRASGAVARRRQGRVVVRKVVNGGSGKGSGQSVSCGSRPAG